MLELALPNSHALAVMILIIVALILFTRESIPLQTTSLLVLVALSVGFTLFPFEADGQTLQASDFFLGFGHKALVAVCGLMIVGQGLIRTGALEPVGRLLARLWRKGPAISLLFTILITAVLSAFINNTPHPDRRVGPYRTIDFRVTDTDGVCKHHGWHGHDHRYLDQPAGGQRGGRHGNGCV